jgi:hypothetical protein
MKLVNFNWHERFEDCCLANELLKFAGCNYLSPATADVNNFVQICIRLST